MPEGKEQITNEPQWAHSHARLSDFSPNAYWIVALGVAILALLYHHLPGSLGHPLDDGYISLHSAQVLRWGADPNFPGVPPLVGITNAPFVLLLWALLPIMPPLVALEAASWLGIACYALGLAALGRAFRLPLAVILLIVALGLAVAKVPYHLLNGVETGMAMGITAWILALAKTNTKWSRRAAALLSGVAPFVRPELFALAGLTLAAIFAEDYREQRSISQAIRRSAPLWLIALAAALPWVIWYQVSTGAPIPQSIEAKRLFFAEGCRPSPFRWHVVSDCTQLFVGMIGFLVLSLVFLVRNNLGRSALIFVWLFFVAYYERLPGGLFHNWGRYMYVLIPIFVLGLISGLADRSIGMRRAAYMLLFVSCLQTAISFPGHWKHFLRDRDGYTQSLASVAAWSNSHLPENAMLLVHDVGYMSFATRLHMIDFVGLKTPSSIDYNRAFTYGTCGIGRPLAVSEIARHAKPDYLIVVDDWDRDFKITSGLREIGWRLQEIAPPQNYHVFRLTPPQQPLPSAFTIQ